jgi:hypothetical protein
MKFNSKSYRASMPQAEREIWDRFSKDHELLERLGVTTPELEALANCVLLGTLTCKQDLLFILQQIRAATAPSADEPTISPMPVLHRDDKATAKEFTAPTDPHPAAVAWTMPDPGSLQVIAYSRAIEQFGVFFWVILLIGFLMWNFIVGLSTWRQHFFASIGVQAYHSTAPEVWDGDRLDRI